MSCSFHDLGPLIPLDLGLLKSLGAPSEVCIAKNGMATFVRLKCFQNLCYNTHVRNKEKAKYSPAVAWAGSFPVFSMKPSSPNTDGVSTNTKTVRTLQSIMRETDSWEQCWVEKVTPWDLGRVTPVLADLVEKNDLPTGRALVPGCGLGYDVVALASPKRHVTGLDISLTALEQARKVWTETKSSFTDFVCLDFFKYEPGAPFDLIVDYTFFCALQPSMRPLWGSKMAELLGSDGELITIMFPLDNFEGGPPYAVSLEAYEKVLHPHGLQCVLFHENDLAVEKRKGREFLGRWRRGVATKL